MVTIGTRKAAPIEAGRWYRPTMFALAVVLGTLTGIEWAVGWFGSPGWRFNNGDLTIYTDATRRLFDGGGWFLERQLSGTYAVEWGDVLYPPATAFAFAPWLVLPAWTFVVIPAFIVGWLVIGWRPAPWAWPLMAVCLLWPASGLKFVSQNPTVWIAAFVGLGLRYRWPGVLVLLKPSFLPLALIGIGSRGWWIGLGALVLLSLPFLADTLAYPGIVLGARSADGLLYSLSDLPLVLVPVVAWAGRRGRLSLTSDAESQPSNQIERQGPLPRDGLPDIPT